MAVRIYNENYYSVHAFSFYLRRVRGSKREVCTFIIIIRFAHIIYIYIYIYFMSNRVTSHSSVLLLYHNLVYIAGFHSRDLLK